MGSPTIPDPSFDQTSATTLSEFSRRKSLKKISGKASKSKSLVSTKRMSKRRPK